MSHPVIKYRGGEVLVKLDRVDHIVVMTLLEIAIEQMEKEPASEFLPIIRHIKEVDSLARTCAA